MAYWIKTVAEMTGIPKNTLIAWERRYGLVSPSRTESGYRVYTDEDVALLRRVQQLIAAGHRISEAANLVQREPVTPDEGGLEGVREALRDALLAFDRAAAERVARRLVTMSFERRVEEVLLPLLREIGDGWEQGTITVAQEHFASAWCRERLLAMARALEPGAAHAPEAICLTPPGELHEFGLLAAAFWLAGAGYRLTYLGADVPEDEILELVAAHRPALVAISAVRGREDLDLPGLAARILAAQGGEGRVLVGGAGSEAHRDDSTARVVFGASRQDIAVA